MKYYYAVRTGRTPGIYTSWDECRTQIFHFPAAIYKKFSTMAEAEAFMQNAVPAEPAASAASAASAEPAAATAEPAGDFPAAPADSLFDGVATDALAYVDGSFNAASAVYGYGVVILARDGSEHRFQGSGSDPELSSMRNVAGEIHGAMRAVKEAVSLGIPSLTVFYDYLGIQCWAEGIWKANKKGTQNYRDFIKASRAQIDIRFHKVKAHSGVHYNEIADRLAKDAVGNN